MSCGSSKHPLARIELLRQAGGVSVDRALHLVLPARVAREAQRLMATSLWEGSLADGLVRVSRGPARADLSLLIAPLPGQSPAWMTPSPRWLLLISDPETYLEVDVQILRHELEISGREAEVAGLLVRGCDLATIAVRLRISIHTARAHLKSIFAKTGVTSQAELAKCIVSGPAFYGQRLR
jgi:DNA-binding CsgD family transcriptional regulator